MSILSFLFKDQSTSAEAENARMKQITKDTDDQLEIDWQRLLELAFNTPGQIVHIAQDRAPEATARVAPATPRT